MTHHIELQTLRAMAWQRAKGELYTYLDTFWPEYGNDGKKIENGFERYTVIGWFLTAYYLSMRSGEFPGLGMRLKFQRSLDDTT